jgi:hypothetical protein
MALGKKAYPKATVKKIIKAHSNHGLKKNADVTVSSQPAPEMMKERDKQTCSSRYPTDGLEDSGG